MHGVLYQRGVSSSSGSVVIRYIPQEPTGRSFSSRIVRGVGVGFVAMAFVGVSLLFYPFLKAEVSYYSSSWFGQGADYGMQEIAVASRDTVEVQKEASSLGVSPHFSVVIPSIGASSDVIANVNPSDQSEYERALKNGVAHSKGTYFPGQGENIFMFAHSTDSSYNFAQYNAVFYLLPKVNTIEEDGEGDRVVVFFADQKYIYEIESKHVVDASDTSWFEKDFGGERLILQTCTPPGTVWKRLVVVAKPI